LKLRCVGVEKPRHKGDPIKSEGLYGERKSTDTGGAFPTGKRSIVPVALTTGQAEHPAVCRPHPLPLKGRTGRKPGPTLKTKKEESMSENRKRNVTLTIRVTPAEKDAILKKVKQADMTLTDYLVTSALRANIYVAEDLKRRAQTGITGQQQ